MADYIMMTKTQGASQLNAVFKLKASYYSCMIHCNVIQLEMAENFGVNTKQRNRIAHHLSIKIKYWAYC